MSLIAQTEQTARRDQLDTPVEDRWLSSAEKADETSRAKTELERELLLLLREIPHENHAAIMQMMRGLARPAA